MAESNVSVIGFKELRAAILRNPKTMDREVKKYLQRGLSKYKRGIENNPWGVSSKGGGAPVATGNLRDTHLTRIQGYTGTIGPNLAKAPYARYVISGTRRGLPPRDYLSYVKKQNEHRIQSLYRELLRNISRGIAR